MRGYGTTAATPIRRIYVGEALGLALPSGSMGPKVEACRIFTEASGHPSAIGALADVEAVLAGTRGTSIVVGHGERHALAVSA
ncbi:MAG TPA: hypothetical protein VGL04_06735 [Sporichthyaceae bacterium]|jgi:carbamate kinase